MIVSSCLRAFGTRSALLPLRLNLLSSLSRNISLSAWRRTNSSGLTKKVMVAPCRLFSVTAVPYHGHVHEPLPGEEVHISFVTTDGEKVELEVAEGDNLLDIAQANDLDMEGACGGSCACSTCHVIIDSEHYDLIAEPDDDENDMLDLAFGLTETSRLGCQVKVTKELDGLVATLPSMTRNLQARDFNK
ncbi:2Fe-2S iron-sulfur cluster binding domain-protein [Lipomyces japonicus]|uniref:2Fe-2S iron-sulfur cluster binding domain-protein n=1 Tax=Lipomyces japonicus TaxID=56871 RepID=UPI0034CF2920